MDRSDEPGAVRLSARRSPKVAWRPSEPVANNECDSAGGGIFDDSFDTNYAIDAGSNHFASPATQSGQDTASTVKRNDMNTASGQQAMKVSQPSSYFETELQSDSPLPLHVPGEDRGQVTRVEFNEMAVQLRQISEQQQKLVELIEASYGALEDRMGAVEASVQTINSRLGLT